MLYWQRGVENVWEYRRASRNQHGDRYRRGDIRQVPVGQLYVEMCKATVGDLERLILLGDMLGVPVHYDFKSEQNRAYIEIVSAEALRKALA